MASKTRRMIAEQRRRLWSRPVSRSSSTPGKKKNASCQKSPLKTWGIKARPHRLSGADLERYSRFCAVTDAMNKVK